MMFSIKLFVDAFRWFCFACICLLFCSQLLIHFPWFHPVKKWFSRKRFSPVVFVLNFWILSFFIWKLDHLAHGFPKTQVDSFYEINLKSLLEEKHFKGGEHVVEWEVAHFDDQIQIHPIMILTFCLLICDCRSVSQLLSL